MTTKRIFITVPTDLLDQVKAISKKDITNISGIYVTAMRKHLIEYNETFGIKEKAAKPAKEIKPTRTIVQCTYIGCKKRYIQELSPTECPDCKRNEWILSPN